MKSFIDYLYLNRLEQSILTGLLIRKILRINSDKREDKLVIARQDNYFDISYSIEFNEHKTTRSDTHNDSLIELAISLGIDIDEELKIVRIIIQEDLERILKLKMFW